ncbi:MAG: hypothetical protein GC168_21365 [Candidatus Hydrogenedens sp.]|nr:hypothetical protein [Candidatus Hydrogenedens sp.]
MSERIEQGRIATAPSGYERGLLAAALIIGPLVFSLEVTSFLEIKEAWLLAALTLAVASLFLRGRLPAIGPHVAVWAPLWLCLAYGLLRGGLSPAGSIHALVFAGILGWAWIAGPLLASDEGRTRLLVTLLVSGVLVGLTVPLEWSASGTLWAAWSDAAVLAQGVLTSTFGNRDLLGGYLAIALGAGLALFRSDQRGKRPLIAACVFLFAMLLASGSRSAWLAALAAAMFAAALARPGKRTLLVAVPGAGFAMAFATILFPHLWTGRVLDTFAPHDAGTWTRLWLWEASLRMLADHGLLGVGLGRYSTWSAHYMADAMAAPWGTRYPANGLPGEHAHNDLLELLCENGLPGLLLVIVFLYRLRPTRDRRLWVPLLALGVFGCSNAALFSAPHALAGVLLLQATSGRSASAERADWPRRVAALGCMALAPLHLAFAVWPSHLLTRAEEAHLQGKAAVEAYLEAAVYPYTRSTAMGFAAMQALDTGQPAAARSFAAVSLRDRGWPELLAVQSLAAARLPDYPDTKPLLREALRQWPVNQAVFHALWECAAESERTTLRAHATRWNLHVPEAT